MFDLGLVGAGTGLARRSSAWREGSVRAVSLSPSGVGPTFEGMGRRSVIPVVAFGALAVQRLGPRAAHAEAADLSERAHAEWIMRAAMADGAIAHYVDQKAVWPYLSNFAAMGLARASRTTGDPRYVAAVWRWLRWYQDHQDGNGYVTDYNITNGAPVSTGDMDSTDAYAGTYLLGSARGLAHDRRPAAGARPSIAGSGAVAAIESTQQSDGLTWATPSWRVKYLMDQAETYAGLRAAQELA